MNYLINIIYTDNQNKAGKLTLINAENKEVLLNKVPVAVPYAIIEHYLNNSSINLVLKNTEKNQKYSSDTEYSKIADKFTLMELSSVAVSNKGFNFIPNIPLGNNRDSLNATADSFVLHKGDYEKIKSICNEDSFGFNIKTNKISLVTEKVLFLWFPEKVNIDLNSTNISKAIKELQIKEETADINFKLTSNKEIFNQKYVQIRDSSKTIFESVTKNDIPVNVNKKSTEQPVKQGTRGKSKQHNSQQSNSTGASYSHRNYSSNNDLDALDIILMYNNPSLAPIFKPNSMLAWALYFNEQNNEVSNSSVKENLKSIPGFESIEHSEVKYSPGGYSVSMYEDEQKQKLIGTLVHDNSSNSYIMESPSGSKTELSIDDNGDAKGFVSGEKGNTSFDLVQNPNGGYTGNWESESTEGIKVSSGVSLSDDFTPTSAPFEPVNIQSVTESRDSYKETMSYEPTPDTAPKWEPPPPPPPPPPSDDMRWGSSGDSYSNSSSFSP